MTQPDSSQVLPIALRNFANAIDESGEMRAEVEERLSGIDLQTRLTQCDMLLGILSVRAKFRENPADVEAIKLERQEIHVVVNALPALKQVAEEQRALKVMGNASGGSDAEDELILEHIRAVKEMRALSSKDGVSSMLEPLKRVHLRTYQRLHAHCLAAIEEVDELVAKLNVAMNGIDMKDLCKNFDARKGDLLALPNRADIVSSIKKLNGINRGGIKRLDKMSDVVSCDDVAAKRLSDSKENAVKLRADARLLISLRAAASIVQSGCADQIDGLLTECKVLKIKLPKHVTSILAAIPKA